ncbi:hypothetical protein AB836_01705 [Rickettsiales bacterium (ex Bugula neritina AB1)]|nr:hypothetical protein AB836_01705 [Rickettsiales bacterium (ex Bugula neritina AB1)]
MEEDDKKRLKELVYFLRYCDFMYYLKNISVVTDIEYDKLKKELEDLEIKYPDLIMSISPNNYVGFSDDNILEVKKHLSPMLSLKNSYNIIDIINHINKYKLLPVLLEAKIDGISLSIVYENFILKEALLRGNGHEGEDVTNIIVAMDIPLKINNKNIINIRGEVYINQEDFLTINNQRKKLNLKLFQTCRNCVGGILRQKTHEYIKYLKFFPYYTDLKFVSTQEENHKILKDYGFKNLPYVYCDNIDKIKEKTKLFLQNTYSYQIDGIVIKPNNLEVIKNLNTTNRYPRALIAYKFSQSQYKVKVIAIKWQVTRTYKIIPICKINEIIIDGAKINSIYLYNKKYLHDNKINIGSEIIIERVGGTAPQIKEVVKKKFLLILYKCIVCNFSIKENNINYLCSNKYCIGVIKDLLLYFSRMLNFKGLGEENIHAIIIKENIKFPSELLYILIFKNNISYINGYQKIQNFVKSIFKKISLFDILRAYGFSKSDLKNFNGELNKELLEKKLTNCYENIYKYQEEINNSYNLIINNK